MTNPRELFRIDRESKLPLYEKIVINLRELIQSGMLKPGEAIPPELSLVEYYGVSRLTIRKAIDELERSKLLIRRQGIGTFVNDPVITSIAPSKLSFTDQVLSVGQKPSSKLISREIVEASQKIAQKLHLNENEPVVCIIRLRLADGVPILLETASYSQRLFPSLEFIEDFKDLSIYEFLSKEHGKKVTLIEQTLSPVLLSEEEAGYLSAAPGSASIHSESVAFSSDGQPIEYSFSVANGENCEFYFTFNKGE